MTGIGGTYGGLHWLVHNNYNLKIRFDFLNQNTLYLRVKKDASPSGLTKTNKWNKIQLQFITK